jgi:hypothetical protein
MGELQVTRGFCNIIIMSSSTLYYITPLHFDCPCSPFFTLSPSPLQNLSHFSGVFLGWVFVAESGPPTPGLTHFTLARVIRSLGIPVRSLGYQNSNVFTSFNWSFKLLENYHFWCNRKRRAYRRCQILCSSTT